MQGHPVDFQFYFFNFQSQETKSLESVAQFDRIAHIKYVLQSVVKHM